MELLDNNLLDFWWDDIIPFLSGLNYSQHELTPELVKYKCLKENWMVFKYPTCVIIGSVGLKATKEFYINWWQGSNMKEVTPHFIQYLANSGVKTIRAHCVKGVAKLLTNKAVQKCNQSLKFCNTYIIDLDSAEYRSSTCVVERLPQFNYENWLPSVEQVDADTRGYLRNLAVCDRAVALKVKDELLIGFIDVAMKKSFIVAYASDSLMLKRDCLDNLLYFVESQLKCRYVEFTDKGCIQSKRVAEILLKNKPYKQMYEGHITLGSIK